MNLSQQLPKVTQIQAPKRAALGLVILIIAGYAGNYFRWTLFFDIDFIFGSIAVWIVACLYGTGWGTLAGFIAGICTYTIWHHPYTIITFTCEVLFVSLLFHRQRQNIVLLDGIFWLIIGMPLIWLFYAGILHVDSTQVWMILFKQPVNGILNTLIASLIVTHLPIHKWIERPQAVSTLSLQQTLFNLLVAFVLLPTLTLIVLNSHSAVDNIETAAQKELNVASNNLVVEMRSWHLQHLRAVSELAKVAAQLEPIQVAALQPNMEFVKQAFPDFHKIYITDTEGREILATANASTTVFSPSQHETGNSATGWKIPNKSYLEKVDNLLQPIVSDVFTQQSGASPPRIVLSIPVLRNNQLRGFVVAEIELSGIESILKSNIDERELQITILNDKKSAIASTQTERLGMQTFDRRQDGEIRWLAPGTYHWLPITGSRLLMVRWNNSFFVRETAIDTQLPWTLIVELPAQPHVQYIEKVHTHNLAILVLICAIALLFAALLSRRLVGPLSKLAQVTTNLPGKLLERELIDWPKSSVAEMDSLVSNFKWMATNLNQKFREIKSVNATLERRVQERTQQLLKTNGELEAEIAERKRAEEKLKAYTVKLEQSNRELQDFAFVASHDLQEPLRKIQAFGDCLNLEFSASLPSEGRDYVERMQKAAHRMQTLIDDLLTFSRVATKAQPFVPVNIGQVAQEVMSDLEVHIEKVGARVEVGYLPTIDADPVQMRQLLQNLLSNALKFHCQEESPVIKIWSQCWDSQEQFSGGKLLGNRLCQIIVADNGIGFDDEKYLDRIFTVFQRLHGRNEYEGTGIGLSICRKIAERHGGSITAKSKPGQGATFIVSLPFEQPK